MTFAPPSPKNRQKSQKNEPKTKKKKKTRGKRKKTQRENNLPETTNDISWMIYVPTYTNWPTPYFILLTHIKIFHAACIEWTEHMGVLRAQANKTRDREQKKNNTTQTHNRERGTFNISGVICSLDSMCVIEKPFSLSLRFCPLAAVAVVVVGGTVIFLFSNSYWQNKNKNRHAVIWFPLTHSLPLSFCCVHRKINSCTKKIWSL